MVPLPSLKKNEKKDRRSKRLTSEKISQAEKLLFQGITRSDTAEAIDVSYDVLRKALADGRIKKSTPITKEISLVAHTKSNRNKLDEQAANSIGVACTRTDERIAASFGVLHLAESRFGKECDVTNGGVLFALPALCANGLYLNIQKIFTEFTGYYSVTHILTLLAFMGLCRIKTIEQLRYNSPGEFGELLGLDRIPGVKCLREKLTAMSNAREVEEWSSDLSKKWMGDSPDLSGALYIDGHVRLYDGKEKLPKIFVSRQKLCLKGLMDFWVNDKLGQPFFMIRTEVNPGMLNILRKDIVPRLLEEVPNQPTHATLEDQVKLHRFILIFDREGYSPVFFKQMWDEHRIACMTYHKHAGENWPENEFEETQVTLVSGEVTTMKLARKTTTIGSNANEKIEVVEVRKLTKNSHQTSIVSTAYTLNTLEIAALMFARWCQENFFNYMMQQFAIDGLTDYKKQDVSATTKVTSPQWRRLSKQRNSINGKLKTLRSNYGKRCIEIDALEIGGDRSREQLEIKRAELSEEVLILELKNDKIKKDLKKTAQYVLVSDLPEDEYFQQLSTSKKDLIDTIKMIAYRAETAMAAVITKENEGYHNARSLLQNLFTTAADFVPDYDKKTLEIKLHSLSERALNEKLDPLISDLNDAEIIYPGTNLKLIYSRFGAKSNREN